MASPDPDPKRHRTDPSESTPICLHPAYCKESPEDLKRMQLLINKDPSLLYKVQPEPLRTSFIRSRITYNNPAARLIQPLWSACKVQHLACVNLILQAASGPENHLNEFKFDVSSEVNDILSHLTYGKNNDTCYEIMKSLLEHGMSPNVEIPISEIKNPHGLVPVLRRYKATKLILSTGVLNQTAGIGGSKMLELLLEHGAYPDPVILTESGSILPLYPTLGRHLNPIPVIHHPDVRGRERLTPLLTTLLYYHVNMKHVEIMKILLVYGALLPTYYLLGYDTETSFQVVSSYILYPFDVIIRMRDSFELRAHKAGVNSPWGVKSDGSMCQYYDIILEVLKLYHQFGGNLWGKISGEPSEGGRGECMMMWKDPKRVPCEGGTGECVEWLRDPGRVTPCKTIIEVLEEQISDPDAQSMLVEEVRRMMSTPPSLQHSARLAIRRSMGYGCVRNLKALPLPDGLKKYLKFEDE